MRDRLTKAKPNDDGGMNGDDEKLQVRDIPSKLLLGERRIGE